MSDSKSAQQGQARCPSWASTVPQLGKHRAQFQPESVIRPFNVILYKKNFLFLSKMVIFAANSGYIAKL